MSNVKILSHQPADSHFQYGVINETLVCRSMEGQAAEWSEVNIWQCAAENQIWVGDACQAADDEWGTHFVADWNRAIREHRKLLPPVDYLILKNFSEMSQYSIWSTDTPANPDSGVSGAGYATPLEAVRDFYPEGADLSHAMVADFTEMGADFLAVTYEEFPKLVEAKKIPLAAWLARFREGPGRGLAEDGTEV